MVETNEQTSNGAQTPTKKHRQRSPNYPAESLEAAIKRVGKLYHEDHEAGSTVDSAAVHIGFNKAHGEAKSVLAGLKKFGLVEMAGNRVIVTKRAVSILLFPEEERGKKAVRDAALLPDIYRKLVARYRTTGLPSDKSLRAELIADEGFNPKAVDAFIKDFRSSLSFAGISVESGLDSSEEAQTGDELNDEETQLKTEETEILENRPGTPPNKSTKSKVFNVALDPITQDAPQFAQVLIPVPISEEQKRRLISFLQNL
ncbi:MAG: hypothetical protein Q7S58_03165 [Candidatus Binatus sp.]|uniref:hypothetical protein n=1 Tax=Candidatus Binatus sp. TaxID=2811406 RepID=UPI0027229368|nr:hypothetical protein [Candidatus Binatus sp.]MDO8431389.1 hypothetical protein [Candidatus Binatus sp.]